MNKQQLKKVAAKGDFIFHKEWLEIFQGFSVDKAGQIIKALVDYVKDGIKPDDPELAAICAFLFANVDIDRARIEEAHKPRTRAAAPATPAAGNNSSSGSYIATPYTVADPKPNMTEKERKLWEYLNNTYYHTGKVDVRGDDGHTYLLDLRSAFFNITKKGGLLTDAHKDEFSVWP